MTTIYVGNLPFTTEEEEVRDLFAAHGEVYAVKMISDRETGQPRGFAFVDMNRESADQAIEALDGAELGGRNLRVNQAERRRQQRAIGFGRRQPSRERVPEPAMEGVPINIYRRRAY